MTSCKGILRGVPLAGLLVWAAGAVMLAERAAAAPAATQEHRCEMWVDAAAGEPVAYPTMLADLAGARVVYLGERHTLERHHQWQARIVADLAGRGVPVVLALEQMEAQFQPALDRYNRGEIDFAELARATDWHARWPSYEQYQPVIEAAHKAGMPVLALNARQETIRQIARGGGVRKLDRAMRAQLPKEMTLRDPLYERRLGQELRVHMAATPERLRPMIEAQIARDETMAQTLADYLNSDAGKGRTAVVVTGAGHVAYALGVPDRVRRRLPDARDRIVLFSESGDTELSAAEQAASREVSITHEDLRALGRPIGDYLNVVSAK